MAQHAYGPTDDPRFALHRTQPRANKLDALTRRLALSDPAFAEALKSRVGSADRFAAFIAGVPSYIALTRPCGRCGGYRRRVRDRSCWTCHLRSGAPAFERILAGLRPHAKRTRDSHLDLLERRKRERQGEVMSRRFGRVRADRYPTGRLQLTFDDGYVEHDLASTSGEHVERLAGMLPEMIEILEWAGWRDKHEP